ncbi:MAG: sodium:calcium antiporter [Candidatus Diapherotrites archaeon]|nr:sodium:calcium antiporter [Candidatus Diapherotrites archaeon]
MVWLELGIFLLAFIVLVKSSQWVIDASIKVSKHLGISQLAIGFIIVSMAVSLPDLVVSVISSLQGKPDLGIGDALGSSIANICLVLGIVTLVKHVSVDRRHTLDSAELLLLISIVPMLILSRGFVGRNEGLVLLVAFLFYCFFVMKEHFSLKIPDNLSKKEWRFALLELLAGLALVIVSSKFVVDNAIFFARYLNISEAVIGLTLVSFGTTLPELVIDFTAIRRGQTALAIGDILGSTVTNLTLILGSVLIISPAQIDFGVYSLALAFIVIANSFLVYYLFKHEGIGRKQGKIFLALYVAFIILTLTLKGPI